MTAPESLPVVLQKMDDGLAELSRLHLAYEREARPGHWAYDPENSVVEAADELSAAVGRFLVERGFEAVI